MTCKICGASLAPNETICRNCGASNSTVEPTVPKVEPLNATPVIETPTVEATPVVPAVEPTAESVKQVEEPVAAPTEEPTQPAAEPVEEPKVEETKPEEEKSIAKKDNGKFLVIIGIIVGLLATAVIGYLIYSSLKAKNNGGTAGTVVTKSVNYTVLYADYKFDITGDITASSGTSLSLTSSGWEAKISYAKEPEFDKITSGALKKTFETVTDYKVGEFIAKNYGGVSCLEANVDYTDGVKTNLLLLKRDAGGYWYVEIAKSPYTAYPENSIAEEVISLITKAKKAEEVAGKLNIKDINIKVEDETTKVETPTE